MEKILFNFIGTPMFVFGLATMVAYLACMYVGAYNFILEGQIGKAIYVYIVVIMFPAVEALMYALIYTALYMFIGSCSFLCAILAFILFWEIIYLIKII